MMQYSLGWPHLLVNLDQLLQQLLLTSYCVTSQVIWQMTCKSGGRVTERESGPDASSAMQVIESHADRVTLCTHLLQDIQEFDTLFLLMIYSCYQHPVKEDYMQLHDVM